MASAGIHKCLSGALHERLAEEEIAQRARDAPQRGGGGSVALGGDGDQGRGLGPYRVGGAGPGEVEGLSHHLCET